MSGSNTSDSINPAVIDGLEAQAIRLNRDLAVAMSNRQAAIEREQDLTLKVGHAKGRLELKDAVTQTLERLQEAVYEKTVGSYAKLLTSLVHEVIDPQTDIIIDLGIERGAPALSVWSCITGAPEFRSSIYENSGAMTNVVGAGLRIITTAKSGGRRFLMLDEPDCWIPSARVPHFYNVLRELCEELDFQILVVSHHPPELFGEMRIIPLLQGQPDLNEPDGDDDNGDDNKARPQRRGRRKKTKELPRKVYTAETGSPRGGTSWRDISADRPGIRQVRIKNFATLKDVKLDLDPYLTVISGDSNVGKSRITRAFRAAFYGSIKDVDDSDIRYGESSLSIDMVFEHDHVLSFSRDQERNPINLWELKNADGELLQYEGSICHEGGTKSGAPHWVSAMLGILRGNDLDIQISHQKSPVFLIDQPPSRQASVLSIGQEVEWLSTMQSIYKKWLTEFNQTAKNGEIEIANIRERLKNTEGIEDLINEGEKISSGVSGLRNTVAQIKEIRSNVEALGQKIAGFDATQELQEYLAKKLEDLVEPSIDDFPAITDHSTKIRTITSDIQEKTEIIYILEELPSEPQITFDSRIVVDADNMRDKIAEIDHLQSQASLLADLPEAPELPDPYMSEKSQEIKTLQGRIAMGNNVVQVLSELPEQIQIDSLINSGNDIQEKRTKITDGLQNISSAKNTLQKVEAEYAGAEDERARLIEEAGGECPVCLSPLIEDSHKNKHEKPILRADPVPEPVNERAFEPSTTSGIQPQQASARLSRRGGFGAVNQRFDKNPDAQNNGNNEDPLPGSMMNP